jgi:nicotinamidase-related amidase
MNSTFDGTGAADRAAATPDSVIPQSRRLITMSDLLDLKRSIVLVIDLQGKLMDMIHRPALVIEATNRLLSFADIYRVPVLLTEQYPRGLGPTHPEVQAVFDRLETEHRYLDKTAFGCCGDDNFEKLLQQLRPGVPVEQRQIVVAGIEAHVCVMQTVIELLRAGNQVHLCWECISGRGEEYRRHALDRMQQAGAVLTNHESVGFEWARDTSHPGFKAMSALLKEGQPT